MTQIFQISTPKHSPYIAIFGIIVLMAVLLLVFILISTSMKKISFEVSDTSFKINSLFHGRTLALSDLKLESVRLIDIETQDEFRPVLRTAGVSLPGFQSGWYKLNNGDSALLFVSDKSSLVMIPTKKDYVILLSTKDPQGLVGALKR